MSKFSVKQPFTVLVGIVLVLVLGVVAFTKMTTDLLPNMDLPYMVVYASDPGATPEAVEESVTKPLESALGSTTGLKNITSVSSENVGMVIMEFAQGTDMNAISIEMSNTIDQIKGTLPENASTPVMMQITPDMMPVMVASVDVDGMESKEVSDYISDELLSRFERLDGVASVDTTGLLTSEVQVTLDQDKIDELNDKVLAAVDENLAEAKQQLDEGQAELDSAKAQLKAGQNELDSQADSATAQLSQASAQVDSINAQLNALLSQETTLTANKTAFETEKKALQQYADMDDQVRTLAIMIVAYDLTGNIPNVSFPPTSDDITSIANSSTQVLEALKDPATYIGSMTDENYAAAIQALQGLASDKVDLSQISGVSRSDFTTLVTTTSYASERVEEISNELNNINTELATASAMKTELQSSLEQAQEAYAQLEAAKLSATIGIAQGAAQLTTGEASLESAQQQLDQATEEFEDARDAAYESADISGIVTADMISNILVAENFEMPAGYISDASDNSYVLKVGETYDSIDDLSNMILFSMDLDGIGDIRLSDVASVEYASENEDDSFAQVNGNDAVILSFSKQSTASTSTVSEAINEEIEALQAENEHVHVTPLMDQGDYIQLIVSNVLSNLVFGGLLAVLVLLVFLRDLRPTIIIAFSIPLSVLFAIVLMYFSNMTLNIISLSGLALGVGMLVDNSIVVIENIYRLRNLGMPAAKAAVHGAQQMSGAIFASTLTTICVFLPIVFTEGITRQLFADMGLTIAYSLSASFIVALTVVPAMGASMLKKEKATSHSRFNIFLRGYERVLRWCLAHRAITLGAAVALLIFAGYTALNMGMIFIPSMSSDQMSATLTMPDDSDDIETEATVDKAMQIMQDMDGIQTVGAMSGSSNMMSSSGGDASVTFYLILEEGADNSVIADEIEQQMESVNCEISVSESNMDLSSVSGSGVQIDVYGDDLDQLQEVCADLAKNLEQVEGLEEISDGNEDPDMQKVITVNKDAAMREGLTVAQVYASLAQDLTNEVNSTTLSVGEEDLQVVVIKPSEVTTENLMEQTVESTDATTGETKEVALDTIASQKESQAPTSINRSNNERMMSVTAAVDDDHNVTLVSSEVQTMLDNYDTPDGIRMEITGENETIMDAMSDLMLMLLLAVIFIYLIMVAQFQSLLSPFIVMFTLPLAFTGGFLALVITRQELSVISMLGFILLAGVVVNNGIVFVSCVNELRLDGMPKREALVEAGKMRMRPILMTALTTVLSMSTMALGIGAGAEMGQSMAIVVIGGLSYATVLTLIIVPIIYDLLNRKKELKRVDIGEQDGEDDV
ncbi:MAG: efflux RND transporter permease subunit [Eubacteriales bacterium]|nr:efflux RND transporter permease subunit [Eubacteriales bacterium]